MFCQVQAQPVSYPVRLIIVWASNVIPGTSHCRLNAMMVAAVGGLTRQIEDQPVRLAVRSPLRSIAACLCGDETTHRWRASLRTERSFAVLFASFRAKYINEIVSYFYWLYRLHYDRRLYLAPCTINQRADSAETCCSSVFLPKPTPDKFESLEFSAILQTRSLFWPFYITISTIKRNRLVFPFDSQYFGTVFRGRSVCPTHSQGIFYAVLVFYFICWLLCNCVCHLIFCLVRPVNMNEWVKALS